MALNGFRMLYTSVTAVREIPNLWNTMFTTKDNVVEESTVMARFWNMIAVITLSVGLVVFANVEIIA
jgi:hypothetical protein